MGRVTFQKSLQKYRTWLEPSKESIYHAKCIACDASLDISNGISNLQNHEKTKKHRTVLIQCQDNQLLQHLLVNLF